MNPQHHLAGQMSVKNLEMMARKAKQAHLASEAQAKSALAAGNLEKARIHAEAAIRQKGEAMQYLRLAAQVDGAQSRVASAVASQQAIAHVGQATAMLEQALPPDHLERVANTLDAFNAKAEQIDMSERIMNSAMSEASAMTTPTDQVDDLVRKIAAEHHIDTAGLLPAAPNAQPRPYAAFLEHTLQQQQMQDPAHGQHNPLAPPRY